MGRGARYGIGLAALSLMAAGCLRPLLTDEEIGDGGTGAEDSEGETSALGATTVGDADDSGTVTGSSTGSTDPACHPSYDPCLPLVDDLNCPDVVALGAAPVTVIGPDDYGLDADGDGIGCES